MIMENKIGLLILLLGFFFACESNPNHSEKGVKNEVVDSVQESIESKVEAIIAMSDSLQMVPSLRYAKGETETYTAKMYGKNQVTLRIREEHFSNEIIIGRDYFYDNNRLIFIKEEGSVFDNTEEVYVEKMIYVKDGGVYKAFEKHEFTEDDMFSDTLYQSVDFDISSIDLGKPLRAIEQRNEFAMYFDEFLFIDPQTYLIVENKDNSINAALYIIEGDSLINEIYSNPSSYEGKRLWVYHSFREMSGIERMIYEGSVLLPAMEN